MGILRIVLAISVIVAHVGQPLFGLSFFGGGVMSVESFFIISGFYMALILKTKYKTQIKDFYFNRFIRLFPLYWLFIFFTLLASSSYWLILGKPLGFLSSFLEFKVQFIHLIWAFISNLTTLGIDAAILYSRVTGVKLEAFIVIPAAWSVSVEIIFYALAPWILRRNLLQQASLFLLFLCFRIFIFIIFGYGWTIWNYYFLPTAMPFFLGGSLSYCLYEHFEQQKCFKDYSPRIGLVLLTSIVITILLYSKSPILTAQDWRYYVGLALSIPFIFQLSQQSKIDRLIGEYSYPIYLVHAVVLSLWSPLRYFISENFKIYGVILVSLLLSTAAIEIDKKIQLSFKRKLA